MSSDEDEKVVEVINTEKRGRPKGDGIKETTDEVVLTKTVLTKSPKKKVPTQKQLDALNANRGKALEKLTAMRREKAKLKEEAKREVEERTLDKAPKVREIDSEMARMKQEMEELKKQLSEKKTMQTEVKEVREVVKEPSRKVKKIVYEDDDEEVEEVVEVVKRKSATRQKPITGTELLDRLFFTK